MWKPKIKSLKQKKSNEWICSVRTLIYADEPIMQTQREPLLCSVPIYMMIPNCSLASVSILLTVRLKGKDNAEAPKWRAEMRSLNAVNPKQ
jgi:hypothetical protein